MKLIAQNDDYLGMSAFAVGPAPAATAQRQRSSSDA